MLKYKIPQIVTLTRLLCGIMWENKKGSPDWHTLFSDTTFVIRENS